MPAQYSAASAETHPALIAAARVVLGEMFSERSTASLLDCGGNESWLRAQLATLTRCAKGENLPVERFLVAVKQAWFSLPQLRLALGAESDDMLALVMKLCIEEYFASAPPTQAPVGIH